MAAKKERPRNRLQQFVNRLQQFRQSTAPETVCNRLQQPLPAKIASRAPKTR